MTTDVEQELRSALRASTADVHLSPRTPDAVRARARRHRRRNVVVAATVVVAASVTAVTFDVIAPPDTSSVVVATTPTASATAADLGPGRDVGGVAVTYLPDGLSWHGPDSTGYDPNEYGIDSGMGTTEFASSFDREADRQPGLFPDFNTVGVGVAWNPHRTIDELEELIRGDQPTWLLTRTTVRGHDALAISMTAGVPGSLWWHEQDNLELSVGVSAPLTTEELRRVADGLVVQYKPDIDLDPTAYNLGNAVTDAFGGGSDTVTSLAAVDDSDGLAAVREEMIARYPDAMRSAEVAIFNSAFPDETHGQLEFTIIFSDLDRHSPPFREMSEGRVAIDLTGRFVLTDSGWKIDRATFCEVANLFVSRC